jgi:DNA-binding NtrC family response regulator
VNRKNHLGAKVLITDDDEDIRWMLSMLLREEGLETLEAIDGPSALKLVYKGVVDLMLLDLTLPGMNGLEVLREVRKVEAGLPVIILTGHGTTADALAAGKTGIQGFLTKPFKNDEIALMVWMALESCRFARESRTMRYRNPNGRTLSELMGPSAAIQAVLERVQRVAATDFTVIINGETGAGKEVIANAVHNLSERSQGPFVPVDCGSIPPTLIESELFGHEKGAFTGADRVHKGCFEAAAGGTLFLDEIGNLPLSMQSKLLRALQQKRISRVGSTTLLDLNVRVLCATHESLPSLVAKGEFRQDLYYRLNEFDITVPPLRERRDDVAFLARRFIDTARQELKKSACAITGDAVEMLRNFAWPGNVRELQNLIRRAVLLAETNIGPEQLRTAGLVSANESLPEENGTHSADSRSFRERVQNMTLTGEREVLEQALKKTRGNMKKAARDLQMDYKTIRTKIKFHQLIPLH